MVLVGVTHQNSDVPTRPGIRSPVRLRWIFKVCKPGWTVSADTECGERRMAGGGWGGAELMIWSALLLFFGDEVWDSQPGALLPLAGLRHAGRGSS